MAIKHKIKDMDKAFYLNSVKEKGEDIKSRLPAKKVLLQIGESALFLVLGFVFSLGNIIGNIHPFGISVVAVSKRKYFLFSCIGACLGYLVHWQDVYSIRYFSAVVLVALGVFVGSYFDINYTPSFSMILSFACTAVTGAVVNFRLQAPAEDYMVLLGEAVLSGGGAFFLYKSLNANYKRLRFKALPVSDISCIIISVSILLVNLSGVYIGIICPARVAAIAVILTCVKFAGNKWGILLSLCFGFSLSISDRGALFIIGAIAFSSMVATLFSNLSSAGIAISFLCSVGFFCVSAGGELALSVFLETVIAAALFMLMPNVLSKKLEEIWDTGRDAPPDGSLRQNLVLKLRFASSAMASISESVEQVREKINDIARRENERSRALLSDDEYVCREIILEKTNQIRMVASDQFFSISDMLDDLAFEFDEAEIFDANASSKIRRLLGEYEIYPKNISAIEDKYSRMRVEILTDSTVSGLDNPKLCTEIGKICNRYFEAGKITNFKNEAMLSFSEKPNYRLNVGFAQHSAEGRLCGDTVKIINDNKGHSILIISDGMGKGSRAALDGAMGAGLLSKLINAGFGFDSALKVVNSALLVKSNDESLATLDIANIDLFTGKCEIFKAGAPASFIIKGQSVTKCELTSMPAGILRGIEFAKRTVVLRLGDSIALMSDGITDLGEEWLENILTCKEFFSGQEYADYILDEALKRCNKEKHDDMSVVFARLERN